ncbi:hypothetical protein J5N97_005188 [Dioscorea zingiberensis]|uniref:Uncharacterized protein n=1 Tax=Dioscorea zingiberensis TaxID=325984 RepID=A0A9D5DA71_9LILI|nr:hypothetical protein J5N97_005188 [Dioscorea zingiberensis]
MVVHHSNPFLVDMPQADTETMNIGKHGFMSSMEKGNIEDSAPYSYAPRENRHVIDEDITKSSLNEDKHEEVACSIRAAEFATEWNPFLVDVTKLDNVTVTQEEHGFTSSIDEKIFEGNIEDSLDEVEHMEARYSIPSAEEVPYYIVHHNNPFLMDMLKLDNEIVTEGEHFLTLPIEKEIFEDRKPCKELEPAQYSLGHGRDAENVDRIKTSLSEDELTKVPYSVVHQGNPFLVDVPELDDDSVTGGRHDFTLPLTKKIFVEETQRPSHWIYAQGEENFRINEANMKNTQREDAHMEVSCSSNGTEFDTNFYADEMISETEMNVCKEGSCSVIQDICADEVVNSPEKIATEIKEPNGSISSELNHFPSDRDNIVMEGAANSTIPISHDLKASPVNGNSISVFDNDVEEKLGAGSLPEARENPDSTYQDEKGSSAAMIVPFDAKEFKPSHGLGETPADSMVKSGIITFNFDSARTNISSAKESKDDKDHQASVCDVLNRGIEDTATDVATASTQNSVHPNRGESGFSGPIIASGRIPFSGSISHRSDSSTTSARSFAFPILPTEWNSSPVKMAKADHRQLRKQRFWRMVFFCCRF